MLVLTRKSGESVVIDGNIKLTVVQIAPGRVKIGIEAPASVTIDRAEVAARKEADAAEPSAIIGPAIHNRIATRLPVAAVAKPR
jgi:carbon storage regulator